MSITDQHSNGRIKSTKLKLANNLEFFAKNALTIPPKEGGSPIKFTFNFAQQYIHSKIEEQKEKTGSVRAIICKGRQQGCSTYICARYYHKVIHSVGLSAFIMAHNSESTKAIFEMTKSYYDNSPHFVRPSHSQKNQNRLILDKIMSDFRIGTAGSDFVGRGQTIQVLHGSEVAFWPRGGEIATGLIQAVPDAPGTEIILESTAYSRNDFFYTQWKHAERGESPFVNIFVPWYWQPEYAKKLPDGFSLSGEEKEIKRIYSISDEKLYWRRMKIVLMSQDGTDGAWAFKREYPFTSQEAFSTPNTNSFVKDSDVTKARKQDPAFLHENDNDIILGVDPARFGDDKTAMIFRKGSRAFGLKLYQGKDNMEIAGIIKLTLDKYPSISRVYIDEGGGAGIYDRLKELGYASRAFTVNFGSASSESKYFNKRAQMWGNMRQWLADGDVSIPDNDLLHEDLVCVNYIYHSDSKIKLEKKEEIKKRTGRSPDAGDALALTFANSYFDLSAISSGLSW